MVRGMEKYLTLKVQRKKFQEIDRTLRNLLSPEPEERHDFLKALVTDVWHRSVWQSWAWAVLLYEWVELGACARRQALWREYQHTLLPSASPWTDLFSFILGKPRLVHSMHFCILCVGDCNNCNIALNITSRFSIRKLCWHLLEDKLIICNFLGRKNHSGQIKFC